MWTVSVSMLNAKELLEWKEQKLWMTHLDTFEVNDCSFCECCIIVFPGRNEKNVWLLCQDSLQTRRESHHRSPTSVAWVLKSQLEHSIKKKIATPWSWNCLIVIKYCKRARSGKMTTEKGTLQNKISHCCAITFQSILMAKKSPTKLWPLTLAPFSLAVPSSISLIICANCSMFYVSKRQAILSMGSLLILFFYRKEDFPRKYSVNIFSLLYRECCRVTQLLHQPLHIYKVYKIYTLKH